MKTWGLQFRILLHLIEKRRIFVDQFLHICAQGLHFTLVIAKCNCDSVTKRVRCFILKSNTDYEPLQITNNSFFHFRKPPKTFAFDHCFFSTDPDASHFASQEIVFNNVGRDILENAFEVRLFWGSFVSVSLTPRLFPFAGL